MESYFCGTLRLAVFFKGGFCALERVEVVEKR